MSFPEIVQISAKKVMKYFITISHVNVTTNMKQVKYETNKYEGSLLYIN